jgi:hypothetical protein
LTRDESRVIAPVGRIFARSQMEAHPMKDYNVHHIPLDQIDKNPLNPRGRGEDADIKGLLASITDIGLYYPILVNKTEDGRYMIIEGHRRFAVYGLKKLKNPEFAQIPALVIEVGAEYLTKIFREINETSKKLTGKQWLEVHALGGAAGDLPSRLAPAISALAGLFPPDELLLIARRQGPSVYGLARRVAEWSGYNREDKDQLRKVIAWLVNSGDSVNVRVAMQEGHTEKVKKAIANGMRISGEPYENGEIVTNKRAPLRKAA